MVENSSSSGSLYRQRDVTVSHVLRLGIHLFGSKDRVSRRRLFSADEVTSFSQRRRSSSKDKGSEKIKLRPPESLTSDSGSLYRLQRQEEFDYSKWLHARKALRANLEKLGLSQQWLHSKERTALEGIQLRKYEIETLQNPVETREDIQATRPDVCTSMELATLQVHQSVSETPGKGLKKTDKVPFRGKTTFEPSDASHKKSSKQSEELHKKKISASTKDFRSLPPLQSEEEHDRALRTTSNQKRASSSPQNFRSSSPRRDDNKPQYFRSTLFRKRAVPPTNCLPIRPLLVLDSKQMSQPGNAIFQFVRWEHYRPTNYTWQDNSNGYVQFGSLPIY